MPFTIPAVVSSFMDANAETLGYLRDRWQDEKEYEDFSEYIVPFQKPAADAGITLMGMSKSPFALKFTYEGVKYEMRATASQVKLMFVPPKVQSV